MSHRPSSFSSVAVLVAAVVLTGGCSKSKPKVEPVAGDRSFAVVFSSLNFGNIEPCACNNRTQGGFPRRATTMKKLRNEHKALLSVDSGDSLFAERFTLPEEVYMPQAKVKAKEIARAFVKCGLDAFVFGELDLRAGSNFLRDVARDTGLPIVAANVFDKNSGEPVFERYKIFDLDGVKVAVIGLVSPQLKQMSSAVEPDGTHKIMAEPEVRNLEDLCDGDIRIDDPIEVATSLVAELRPQVHLVCILSHLPPKVSKSLPASVPGVDFVFGSHKANNEVFGSVENGGLYLASPTRGIAIGLCEFDVRNGSLMFADHTNFEKDQARLPTLVEWRDQIKTQYGTEKPEDLEAIDQRLAVRMAGYQQKIREVEELTRRAAETNESSFVVTQIVLDEKVTNDPEVEELVRSYRRSLKNVYDPADQATSPLIALVAGEPHVVTDEACRTCHQEQHDFWSSTKHGHAWQTMIDYDAQYDLDCITCHTVGYMTPGGFDRPDRVQRIIDSQQHGYANVQCENCHGPGSNHSDSFGFLDETSIKGKSNTMDCERCHNHNHSPSFKRETYVPRASCPPVDSSDPVARGLLARLLETSKKQLSNPENAQKAYSASVELSMRLGQFEEARALAEEGFAKFPAVRRLKVASARALDALGRTSEAITSLNALYQEPENDRNKQVIHALVDLLLHGRDVTVRDPNAAVALCDWVLNGLAGKEIEWARLRAEALYAAGKRTDAKSYLKKVAGSSPEFAGELADILQRWRRETDAVEEYRCPPPMSAPPAMN